MSTSASKDLDALNKKFGERVIAGDSVQKFNQLVATLHDEVKLMAEDRERVLDSHQEYMAQMNMAHTTAIDIKESR